MFLYKQCLSLIKILARATPKKWFIVQNSMRVHTFATSVSKIQYWKLIDVEGKDQDSDQKRPKSCIFIVAEYLNKKLLRKCCNIHSEIRPTK